MRSPPRRPKRAPRRDRDLVVVRRHPLLRTSVRQTCRGLVNFSFRGRRCLVVIWRSGGSSDRLSEVARFCGENSSLGFGKMRHAILPGCSTMTMLVIPARSVLDRPCDQRASNKVTDALLGRRQHDAEMLPRFRFLDARAHRQSQQRYRDVRDGRLPYPINEAPHDVSPGPSRRGA